LNLPTAYRERHIRELGNKLTAVSFDSLPEGALELRLRTQSRTSRPDTNQHDQLFKMARRNSFDEASVAFRQHLHDLSTPRFTTAAKQTVYEYAKDMQDNRRPPWLYDLTKVWEKLLAEPYTGVTNDGSVRDGLFEAKDEGFHTEHVVNTVERLFENLSEEQKEKLSYPINAREWRAWSNPEFLLRPFGIRLEEGESMFSMPWCGLVLI
jgi:hypothetical protein